MQQFPAHDLRSRLRLAVSVVAVAVGCITVASAQTVNVAPGGTYVLDNGLGTTTYHIGSGVTAEIIPNYASVATPGDVALTWSQPILYPSAAPCLYTTSCQAKSAKIFTESGSTLIIPNPWGWMELQSMITAYGTVVIQPNRTTSLDGSNALYGDVVLKDGSALNFGWNWLAAAPVFGPNTNFIMGTSTKVEIYSLGSVSNVINTISSTDASATFIEHGGSLTINGINTAASAFYGTLTIGGGASVTVGDASHKNAVFGDPTGSKAIVDIQQSSGASGVLSGYGTVDAAVTNAGVVRPGGTTGTLGTLTVSSYTQTSTGRLIVEVAPPNGSTPASASKLVVTGNATLNGTMTVALDSGTYGNDVIPVFQAGSVTGAFSSVSTSGSVGGAIVALQKTSTGYSIVTEKASSSQVAGHLVSANRYGITAFNTSLYDVMSAGIPAGSKGKVTAWLTPTGRIDNVGRNGVGFGLNAFGISGGAQYNSAWKNAVVGVAFGYDHASIDVKNEDMSAHTNTVNVAAYGGVDLQYARLEGTAFYNTYSAATARRLAGYGTAAGKPSGWGWGGSLQLSRSLLNDRIVPFFRGTFARVVQGGFTEDGVNTFDLTYASTNANTFVGDAGIKVNVLRDGPNKLQATVAVRHDFSDPGEITDGSFASLSGSSFHYTWKGDAQNSILVGATASRDILDKLKVFGRVNGEFSLYRRSVNFGIGAKYNF